jgi:hypothetical protein
MMKKLFNYLRAVWKLLIHIKSWWLSLMWAFLFGSQVTLGLGLLIAAVSAKSVAYGIGAIIALALAIPCYRLSMKKMVSAMADLWDSDEFWEATTILKD